MNKLCFVLTLTATSALSGTFWASLSSQAQAKSPVSLPQRLAQANCSASELSRSNPPYRCITPAILRCLKKNNTGGGGSLDYKGGNSGEIVVKGNAVGSVALLGFRFDESTQTLDLNMKKKFFAVPEQRIWDGFKDTISKCRQNPNR
ncbi:MAG: hypothetical protein KME42_02355 [Tildeniella nuda ZEHNDER 1965/U140]|jgi:hypothetical protein|nr:hypothetical protein [Tildeniella nuda ZEHNDER 1965/U140]